MVTAISGGIVRFTLESGLSANRNPGPSVRRVGGDAELPGDDPDRIDPRRVHDAIATQPTPRDAAAEAGITLEQFRYTARRHPL
jgi:hypothetical protein